jgi:lipoprotein-anchoring transpeptidase ErfK/SrfK
MPGIRFLLLVTAFVLAATLPVRADVLITVNTTSQLMTVSVDGAVRWIWPVSTGLPRFATPLGSYIPFWLDEDHYSEEWDDAPMPHSIFFTRRGHAIHGTYEARRLGTPASHGCVRLHAANAAKLFALVEKAGLKNATIIVSSGED